MKYVVLAAFLGIAACTTTGPDSPVPVGEADTAPVTSDTSEVDSMVAQVDGSEADAAVEDPNAIVCVRERITGSRIPKKVCMTRAERDRIREINQENFENNKRKVGKNSPVD